MTNLILLVTFALACQLVKGQTNPPDPVGAVTCHNNHTVDISITNVDDLDEWAEIDWRLQDNAACEPTFPDATTVTYTALLLPDCALEQQQFEDSIKYILKVSATKHDPGAPGQLRTYDHLYYVSCNYDNQDNTSVASFVPIINRGSNDTGNAFFIFTLDVYTDAALTTVPPNPIALDVPLYLKAMVVTQSAAPNLDLLPLSCWASSSSDPLSTDNKVTLLIYGCGSAAVSEDDTDTLQYNCTDNDKTEIFSIRSFRYFGFQEGSSVYFHCDIRVCLADIAYSACACPAEVECYTDLSAKRKRRSVNDFVEEVHVRSGPYTLAEDDKKKEANLAIIVTVSGAAFALFCATAYLVVRSYNKRRQHGDINVST